MLPNEMTVYSKGAFAARVLAKGGTATVHGVTSRGCFLLVRSRWVLFLTPSAVRGPLTLNLRGEGVALRGLKPGIKVEVQPGYLQTGSPEIRLGLEQARLWEPPEKPTAWLSPAERRKHQVETGKQLLERLGASASGTLLSMLLGLSAVAEASEAQVFSSEEVERLRWALRSRDVRRILPVLEWFLGRGPGLTPSGDDLVTGLLLALHRWGDVLLPGLDLSALSRVLLPLAYRKTSALSANLIECASEGQADERLVSTLDGLMAGEPDPGECAARLLDYGGSSGCDAFLGMLVAEG